MYLSTIAFPSTQVPYGQTIYPGFSEQAGKSPPEGMRVAGKASLCFKMEQHQGDTSFVCAPDISPIELKLSQPLFDIVL